ncbi:hypothetical protein BJX70DRAFT_149414 [Aspergillus crustosus]
MYGCRRPIVRKFPDSPSLVFRQCRVWVGGIPILEVRKDSLISNGRHMTSWSFNHFCGQCGVKMEYGVQYLVRGDEGLTLGSGWIGSNFSSVSCESVVAKVRNMISPTSPGNPPSPWGDRCSGHCSPQPWLFNHFQLKRKLSVSWDRQSGVVEELNR